MSVQAHRDDEQPGLEAMESPGRRLRIARQAKGMTTADIATQLHLSSAIINALERDEHDRMPGPVFVRGYLRNYARLLGLDERDVLSEYGGNTQGHTPSATPSLSNGVKKEIRSSHIGVRLITWLIIIGLIALVVAWWQGRIEWPDMGMITPGTQTVVPETDNINDDGSLRLPEPHSQPETEQHMQPPEPEPMTPAPASERIPEEAIAEQARPTKPEEDSGGSPPLPPTAADEELNLPSVAVAGIAESTSTEETIPVTAETAETTPSAPLEQTGQPTSSAGQVVFDFVGACWVDVRDATRKFKLFGEMRKGEQKVLGGTPPYSVILGNSPMVRVTVNGTPFDVEAHSRGNVARFTLDPNALD